MERGGEGGGKVSGYLDSVKKSYIIIINALIE